MFLRLQPGFGSLASTEGKLTPSVFDGCCPEEERSQSAPSIMPASRFRLWQQLAALWWKFQSILSGLRLMAPDLFWWACNFSFNFNTFSLVDRALRNILWLRWRCIGGRACESICIPSAFKCCLKGFLTLQNKGVVGKLFFFGKLSPQQQHFFFALVVVDIFFFSRCPDLLFSALSTLLSNCIAAISSLNSCKSIMKSSNLNHFQPVSIFWEERDGSYSQGSC